MSDIAPIPSQLPNPTQPNAVLAIPRPSDGVLKVGIITGGLLGFGFMVLLHLNNGGEVEYRHKSHKVKFKLGRGGDATGVDQSNEIPGQLGRTEGDQNPSA